MAQQHNEKKISVLIVDDVTENRQLIASILDRNSNFTLLLVSDGPSAIKAAHKYIPDIILLDIMMPGMDGYTVARELKKKEDTKDIPILFVTAINDSEGIVKGFKTGGVDHVSKPFREEELLARIYAHVQLKRYQDELKEKNLFLQDREKHLQSLVDEKTEIIEETTHALVSALEDANSLNDDDTGNHIKRVTFYATAIAESSELPFDFIKRLKIYTSLHDVGKVGISDSLLKKPSRYTDEEFNSMKAHVTFGAKLLSNPRLDPMAKNIALYHHEKWDGSGYMAGLKGENIPMEARIVALADVYDALGSKRVYKEAFPEEKIDRIIREEKGKHFDPHLVDIFFQIKEKLMEIKTELSN